MSFIKLHNFTTNTPIIINPNIIGIIDTTVKNDKRGACIYFNISSSEYNFSVNETPEKIAELLASNNINVIKLHNNNDNSVIYVAVNYIEYITNDNDNCGNISVSLPAIKSFVVNESAEKIESMIYKNTQDKINPEKK